MANAAAPLELVCLFHVAALLEPKCLFSLSKATFLLKTVSWYMFIFKMMQVQCQL